MLRILDRYLVREIALPFFMGLTVLTFILVLPPILVAGEEFISKGVEWSIVARAMATLLPQALSLTIPMAVLLGILVGFGCAIAVHFKPLMSKFLGPIYAVAEGFFLGAISKAFESYQNGIVIQAIGATLAVFAVMLFLYKSRIIKVTDRFRRIIIMATLGLMLFYLVSFVFSLFGNTPSFINQPTGFGIAFSLFAAGLAAMNLALDFDFIERGAKANLPKGMEWYAAFGLLITLVWLYLEMLRLLSKLNRR